MSKTKRVVSILLSLVMLLSVSTMFSITASAEDITLHNGDTITASVYIDGDSTKLICYQLELAFDDSKVSIEISDISVKISNGNNMVNVNNEFSRALVNTTSPTPLSSGVKKNDLLCTFTFHVKDDIPVASIDDYIETKKMIYYDNALGEDIGPTQLRMEISYNKQSFDPEPTVKTYQKGDINCDGSINIVDMQILAKYVDLIKTNPESKLITKYAPMVTSLVKKSNSEEQPYQKGDINCDGSINIVDMQILAKYVDLIKTNPESKLITKYAPMVTCQVAVVES